MDFIIKVIVITSSGALSPGPLTASVIKIGNREGWKAGFFASIGHMIVEFPLVMLIAFGIVMFLMQPISVITIGLVGGAFIIFLGIITIMDARKGFNVEEEGEKVIKKIQSPLLIGLMLSLFNPFFIIWWLGVGSPMVIEAVQLAGYFGILIMYIAHVWMDYAWLSIIAHFSYRGSHFLTSKGYKILMGAIGLLLIYFGVNMIYNILLIF